MPDSAASAPPVRHVVDNSDRTREQYIGSDSVDIQGDWLVREMIWLCGRDLMNRTAAGVGVRADVIVEGLDWGAVER